MQKTNKPTYQKREIKAAYQAVINHVDQDINTLQEQLTESKLMEVEPTCQTIAEKAILRQLQRFRLRLVSRNSRI